MTLSAVRRLALALPEAAEEPHFQATSFRVRARIFATVPPGGAHRQVFVGNAVRKPALAEHGECLEALRWGEGGGRAARHAGGRLPCPGATPAAPGLGGQGGQVASG